jgi:hypothetical protein
MAPLIQNQKHHIHTWNDNIDYEINDSCHMIPMINTINIEQYDLQFDFVINSIAQWPK